MNWLALVLVGSAAAWFEINYQRSRRSKAVAKSNGEYPVTETVHVEERDSTPSISPGAENDKKLNQTA